MSTNFPTSIDSYSTKVDGVDDVMAAHVNDLQDAVVALENNFKNDSSNIVDEILVSFGASPGSETKLVSEKGIRDLIEVYADAQYHTYTPATAANWPGGVDPGNVDDALDALAANVGAGPLGRSFNKRFIVSNGATPTDHFQSGSIPSGFAWQTTGGIFYGTPATLSYNLNSDYLGVTAGGAGQRHFLYKAVANSGAAWTGKVFDMAARGGGPCEFGIRIDDGGNTTNDRFLEFYSTAVAADGTHQLEARRQDTVGGGIITTAMAASVKTFETPFVIRVLVSATPTITCYMISNDGQVQSMLATGTLGWIPTAGRVGIFVKEAGFYSMGDWFYTSF